MVFLRHPTRPRRVPKRAPAPKGREGGGGGGRIERTWINRREPWSRHHPQVVVVVVLVVLVLVASTAVSTTS